MTERTHLPPPPRDPPKPLTEAEIAYAHAWQAEREAWKKKNPRGKRKVARQKRSDNLGSATGED